MDIMKNLIKSGFTGELVIVFNSGGIRAIKKAKYKIMT